ncbi:MAG TPA: hypothetical protein VGF67_28905 [Ktedonobacteraceae bacterium]
MSRTGPGLALPHVLCLSAARGSAYSERPAALLAVPLSVLLKYGSGRLRGYEHGQHFRW